MKLFSMIGSMALSVLLVAASENEFDDSKVSYKDNLMRYSEYGHLLDKVYYDTGSKLDIECYDLQEATAQGRDIPGELLKDGLELQEELRQDYAKLDSVRKNLRYELHLAYPFDSYFLAVENLVDAPATYYDWAGFCKFVISWSNGTTIEIPLNSFTGARPIQGYDNGGGPVDCFVVYGRKSASYIAVSRFQLPDPLPPGDAVLTITGFDHDKGGAAAPVKISVFGHQIFSGANPFPKVGTSNFTLKIPESYLQNVPSASDENPALAQRLDQLHRDIMQFESSANEKIDSFINQTAPYTENLEYRSAEKPVNPADTDQFIRAIDITDILWGVDRLKHPGQYYDYEHLGKMAAEAHANLYSIVIGRPGGYADEVEQIRTFDRYTGVPFLVWADGDKFDNGDIISTTYYGNSEKVIEDYRDFVSEYAKMHNFIGIQIDEPIIPDNEKGYEPLANNAGYLTAYREFAAQRNTELEQLSLPLLDTTPFPAGKVPETATDWVQYIEYQQFKADLMAKHFRNLYNTVKQDGLLASIVCMDMMARNVMDASYISMGKAMPYMGTDLYDNGSIRESISLQLLKSASSGKVIMWPGAGYSCKTPRNFERSMINGLVWADGIHIWTLLYCAKYRDPNFFWALNDGQIGKTDNGMEITETWDLAYWPIVCDIFGKIESIEPELAGRQSANPVALLLSERTISTLVPQNRSNSKYYIDFSGTYSGIAGFGIPTDVRYLETLRDMDEIPYKAMILTDAFAISDKDAAVLKKYVENGGTLFITGNTGSRDEWNQPRDKWALADISGRNGADSTMAPAEIIDVNGVKLGCNPYGKGVCYSTEEADFGQVITAIPENGLSGLLKPQHEEIIRIVTEKALTENAPVKVAVPFGTVVNIQKNKLGHYLVSLVNYDNKSNGQTAVITMPYQAELSAIGGTLSSGEGDEFTVTYDGYAIIVIKPEK